MDHEGSCTSPWPTFHGTPPPPATAIETSCILVYPTTPCAAHPLLSILGYLVAHHGELKVPNVLYGVAGGARGSTLLWATFDYWEMGASG